LTAGLVQAHLRLEGVMIIVDGEVIESEGTAAENGVVAVAYSPEADLFRRFAKEGHRVL
jgi:hypothetical protein